MGTASLGRPVMGNANEPDATRPARVERPEVGSETDNQIRNIGMVIGTEGFVGALNLRDDALAGFRLLELHEFCPNVGEHLGRLGSRLH